MLLMKKSFTETQQFWRTYIGSNFPQVWGTLHVGKHNTGVETLNILNDMMIKIFNRLSKSFSKNRLFFARSVFSDQLHVHFFLWFENNPDCEVREKLTKRLNVHNPKLFLKSYFNKEKFLEPVKKQFPFPEADLHVDFFDLQLGNADLYVTGDQKHDPKKMEIYDSSKWSGTNEFLYIENILANKMKSKDIPPPTKAQRMRNAATKQRENWISFLD